MQSSRKPQRQAAGEVRMEEDSEGRTIQDFGEQWDHFGDNDGFYASVEVLDQILGPTGSRRDFEGKRGADIGSGTGRIVLMLLESGAEHVIAVEPSSGIDVLRKNVEHAGDRVEVIHAEGDKLPEGLDLDFVISIGVIQFIEDPLPTLRAALKALKPGGKLIIWVYSVEGNRPYVMTVTAMRAITTRLPHRALVRLCSLLTFGLDVYIWACRHLSFIPWPMADFMLNTHSRIGREERKYTIYDQLNPTYVKYYRESELRSVLGQAGFTDVELYHRQQYSWTATGVRPE
jgi:SAM-dependent methyltransferase